MSSDSIYQATFADRRSYGLDDLIALNDELVALVKSGVPIERGLVEFSGDLSGRLKALTSAVGERVARGESLPQVLASPDLNLPPIYTAIVSAGMRSGNLAAAMEQLATSARRIAEMRRLVTMSLLYPLIIVWVACGITTALAPKWSFMLTRTYELMRVPLNPATATILWFVEQSAQYVFWIPYAGGLVILLWWFAAGRAASAQPAATARWFRWMPGVRGMLLNSSSATFCEILYLLIEHGEPLPQALTLAGETSGDPRLASAARTLGERLARGERISTDDHQMKRIPALLRWMLAGDQTLRGHAAAIRAAGENYRQRTMLFVEWMSIYVPMLLVISIGGVAVLLFTFGLVGPWVTLLQGIGDGIGRGVQ